MNILLLLPAIFGLIGSIIPVLTESHKSSIITSILSGAFTGSSGSLMNIISNVLGNVTDEQRAELNAQLETLLGQVEVDKIEAASPNLFVAGWRPFLAWGLSLNVLFYAWLWSVVDLLTLCGHPVMVPPTIPNAVMTLMGGLLGIYMTARTYEKTTVPSATPPKSHWW